MGANYNDKLIPRYVYKQNRNQSYCFSVETLLKNNQQAVRIALFYSASREGRVRFPASICQSRDIYVRIKMTLVKSLHSGDPDVIQTGGTLYARIIHL